MGLTNAEKLVIRDYLHNSITSRNRGLIDTFVDAIFEGKVPEPHKYLANLHVELVFLGFKKIWDVRFFDESLNDKDKFIAMIEMEKVALKNACDELSLNLEEVISMIKEDAVEFSQSTGMQFPRLRGGALLNSVEMEYGESFTDTSWLWRSEIFESWIRAGR